MPGGERAEQWWRTHVLAKTFIECRSTLMAFRRETSSVALCRFKCICRNKKFSTCFFVLTSRWHALLHRPFLLPQAWARLP